METETKKDIAKEKEEEKNEEMYFVKNDPPHS
jgi:hypothetical protein